MKCFANMFISGWLGKLTAAYFPHCHICQRVRGSRADFLESCFSGTYGQLVTWLEHEADEAKDLGRFPEAFLKSSLTITVPKPLDL